MDALQRQHSHEAIKALVADGQLYVPCPRCRDGQISVCTDPGNDFTPSRWEFVACPVCHGTREADAQTALDFIERLQETET